MAAAGSNATARQVCSNVRFRGQERTKICSHRVLRFMTRLRHRPDHAPQFLRPVKSARFCRLPLKRDVPNLRSGAANPVHTARLSDRIRWEQCMTETASDKETERLA